MEPIPDMIGRYVVEALVGVGAMGRIFKAHDPDIRRPVALKLISTTLLSSTNRADYIRRFRREAEAAARCVHPNIVTIYDFALHHGDPFLAMEFVHGTSLRQALDATPVLPVADAVSIMVQVLDALECMHGHAVVHQDIKPANVMLTPGGLVKVGDFGVSRIADTELTTSFATAGTPAYMSPEQCRGADVDARSDLFSAGAMLFEMVTGRSAFPGRNFTDVSHRIQTDRLPMLPRDLRLAAPRLQFVLERSMEKHPEDRFAAASEMREALRRVLGRDAGDGGGQGDVATLVARDRPGASPEPGAGSRPGSETPTGTLPDPTLDQDLLHGLEDELKPLVGPIAAILVRTVASRRPSADRLVAELAQSIPGIAERGRFEARATALVAAGRAAADGRSSPDHPHGADRPLPDGELARIEAALAPFVGPIAHVMVRRTAARATSVEALWQSLAQHLQSPGERADFLGRRNA